MSSTTLRHIQPGASRFFVRFRCNPTIYPRRTRGSSDVHVPSRPRQPNSAPLIQPRCVSIDPASSPVASVREQRLTFSETCRPTFVLQQKPTGCNPPSRHDGRSLPAFLPTG